jgi:hypothetical protein
MSLSANSSGSVAVTWAVGGLGERPLKSRPPEDFAVDWCLPAPGEKPVLGGRGADWYFGEDVNPLYLFATE